MRAVDAEVEEKLVLGQGGELGAAEADGFGAPHTAPASSGISRRLEVSRQCNSRITSLGS